MRPSFSGSVLVLLKNEDYDVVSDGILAMITFYGTQLTIVTHVVVMNVNLGGIEPFYESSKILKF